MTGEINPERAGVILSALEQIETLSAFVKAEMKASRGSVGPAPGKQKKTSAEKIKEKARAEFHKRK
ncbi:hypothetical protein [Chryseobacterium sp. SG20098]|uniref:hypothetical protein n=1 Tax=Chryseobacterium sp. SG20098 TaxID=3074145 RepID=UPI0028830F1C|nr:hypothetical protein [Chryseobacterium sp. SG20098]WNI34667.1 hypothetical protein RHP76_11790 [Chryseobacterium sp. SG20098]